MAAETQLIPRKDVRTLFSNIFAIQEVHEAFLKLIESAMESTTGRIISDAFVHSVKCFSVYAEYSCRLPAAQRRFKELTDEVRPLPCPVGHASILVLLSFLYYFSFSPWLAHRLLLVVDSGLMTAAFRATAERRGEGGV